MKLVQVAPDVEEVEPMIDTNEVMRRLAILLGRPRFHREQLERWLRLGLPNYQPGGFKSPRFYRWSEIQHWVNNRCNSQTAGQEVAA